MNKKTLPAGRQGFSIIEALASAAVLTIACAYICAMCSYSSRTVSKCFLKYSDACRAQAVMEKAKETAFELLESTAELTVVDLDANTKKLSVERNGFQIDAIRSRFK
ncbi:MAG: hypothetical protein WC527_07750 [Candidatus Margulisiibacteriota bacterium]